jgi:hypothetical protein
MAESVRHWLYLLNEALTIGTCDRREQGCAPTPTEQSGPRPPGLPMEGYPDRRDVSTGETAMARPQRVEVRSFVLNGDLFDAPFRIKM